MTGRVGAERERIIRRAHENGDIVCGEDGFFIYWPTPLQGALNEWTLRLLADELAKLNAPWVEEMERHFASGTETEGQDRNGLGAEHKGPTSQSEGTP
jgi:hypothetical protein